ncbi:MAG: hypothetical protein KIC94_01370 [Clostridiales bacterium]|nr:hypothetical protein [Clostridiales bacterium]
MKSESSLSSKVRHTNRLRNQTISFRVSPAERSQLEARIEMSGVKKT